LLANGCVDGSVRLWDVATGTLVGNFPGPEHAEPIAGSLAFAPGGRVLAVGSGDGGLQLWAVPDRTPPTAPAAGQRPASIPPAAAAPGRPLRALAKGHWPAGGIQSLEFTPDGRLLASGSDDGVVQLWDMAGGILRRRFEAHG